MSEPLQLLEDLPEALPLTWVVCVIALAVGAFMLAWHSDGIKLASARKNRALYRSFILLSAIAACVVCNIAMPYTMRIVRVVPERPAMAEVAVNLGTAPFLYQTAAKSMPGFDSGLANTFMCIRALSNAALNGKTQCQTQPQCAKFIAGEKLGKAELLQALTFVREHLAADQIKSSCDTADFTKL